MILSRYERALYCVLWIGGVFHSLYNVFLYRKKFIHFEDKYNDFQRGWFSHMPKRDAADFEWETILNVLRSTFYFFIIHLLGSEYFRTYHTQVVPYWQSFVSIIFLHHTVKSIGLCLIISQPFTFYLIPLKRRKYVAWILTGFYLAVVTYLKSSSFTIIQFFLTEVQTYVLMVTLCWVNLRCLSYCLDHNFENYKFAHYLAYCLYLPMLFVGPFVQFKDFVGNFNYCQDISVKKRLLQLSVNVLRYGWWIFITQLSLHYFYINALSYQLELLQGMDNWTLFGYGYSMGQFFHLKYVVFYGLSTSIAKFEHVKTPSLPKCIGRIHLYSDMWKYFDAGLYKFLVTYIYLPTISSGQLCNKLFSSLLSFVFVYIWHGVEYHILVWTVINYVGLCLENFFKETVKLTQTIFSTAWRHRLLCLACSPLLAASAISNFYFFAGCEVGNVFVRRICQSSVLSNCGLLFFLYCCCNLSLEVKRWEQHFHTKGKEE